MSGDPVSFTGSQLGHAGFVVVRFVRFVVGLGKKVLLADVLGVTVREGFALDPATLDAATAWPLLAAFLLQIYFDFSGYSDMALGLAATFGFRLPENFRDPFVSTSVTEFWTRWHVPLTTWMRRYLYVPLGGNRLGPRRTPALHDVAGTAPFHWEGDLADVDALAREVFTGRMNGVDLPSTHTAALEGWLGHLRRPSPRAGDGARRRTA